MLIQGNNITFVHYPESSQTSEAGERFSVLLHETVWERLDRPGETASREYMMMALADIQYIIVKAAHSERTEEAGISEISMDVGQERRTDLSLASAVLKAQRRQSMQLIISVISRVVGLNPIHPS